MRRLRGRDLQIWYHEAYRLPLSSLESRAGLDPRRADLAAWYLADTGVLEPDATHTPDRACYAELALIHDASWLESISNPEVLAQVFGVDPEDIPVDELLTSVRLACGGTRQATLGTLEDGNPHLNLLGGFHHAGPSRGHGLCPLNDIALAIAVARTRGFDGRVVILDLDAHPPDGLCRFFAEDESVWIGSISGSSWEPLPGVDETVLPEGAGDHRYHAELLALLGRMPRRPDLAFIIAGGDILAGDRLGLLGVSPEGALQRDLAVAAALGRIPCVWLPGGGYTSSAWRVLAGTALTLACGRPSPVPADIDPLSTRYSRIARSMDPALLGTSDFLSTEDLEDALGFKRRTSTRLLGYYTAEGIEYSLYTYGILSHIQRLGYGDLRVRLDRVSAGQRMRLLGTADGHEHMLVECVLRRQLVEDDEMLFVHWLSLRNPRVPFSPQRPRLPGQDAPGLGMAREAGEMLARIALRLELAGVAFRPSWYHVAYTARYRFRMVNPELQGRFEALVRDLGARPLLEVTIAIQEGRVLLNGEPYQWEPGVMAFRFDVKPEFQEQVEAERRRCRFTMLPPGQTEATGDPT